jgi:hypothetical protein
VREILAPPLEAKVVVSVHDPELAAALAGSIDAALRRETAACPDDWSGPVVRLRTRKRLAMLVERGRLEGAIVVVSVTPANARHLVAIVDGIRAASAAGVQLVWDGTARERVERHVFAALEHVRASARGAPVILTETGEPSFALRLVINDRAQERPSEWSASSRDRVPGGEAASGSDT